jgi:hypothetical protein
MAKPASDAPSAQDLVRLLVEVADVDTVYRDVHLRRARALLTPELTAEQYRGMQGVAEKIEDTTARSRAAAMVQDWPLVQELATRADELRRSAEATAGLLAVGELVYAAPPVAIDPFSPGLGAFAKNPDHAALRAGAVAALARLAAADPTSAAFYESRRAFLAGLVIAQKRADTTAQKPEAGHALADLERLAYDAAQRGDVGELGRLAQEILKKQAAKAQQAATPAATTAAAGAALVREADPCPVDLGAALPTGTEDRARALGLAVARTEPLPNAAPLFDYVAARLGQPVLQDTGNEHEGAMRIEALVDKSAFPDGVAEHVKVLVGQYVRSAFINSGGARYRPAFVAESVLIEDHPEDEDPPEGGVLKALGLPKRRALARDAIEAALAEHGARILEDQLGLDPLEFRLVCIPQDLYSRFGRDRGWGAAKQWTHFDGYQLIKGGRLRALVGGDARYGGLADLTSIAPSDQRDSVVARFAVIRRARQVARWR